jgi:DMSO/TMAO reductase YedYZ molybdopterin-dependent catalytic subunit
MEQRLATARTKLRKWEMSVPFLDMIWELSLQKTQMELPQILNGVSRKAKMGRVDAARLILEVTGRHNPKGDVVAPNVVIQFGNDVPRPQRRADLDLEPIDEEDVA